MVHNQKLLQICNLYHKSFPKMTSPSLKLFERCLHHHKKFFKDVITIIKNIHRCLLNHHWNLSKTFLFIFIFFKKKCIFLQIFAKTLLWAAHCVRRPSPQWAYYVLLSISTDTQQRPQNKWVCYDQRVLDYSIFENCSYQTQKICHRVVKVG